MSSVANYLFNSIYRDKHIAKITNILCGSEVTGINFKALGIQIRGSIFPTIAADIVFSIRSINVSPGFSGGAAALYHPDTNQIEVGLDDNSDMWKGFVVHEAVHAWIDKNKLNPSALDNESVCYIAQAIYYHKLGMSAKSFSDGIYLNAMVIAGEYLRNGKIKTEHLQSLRTQIIVSPTYFGKIGTDPYLADG